MQRKLLAKGPQCCYGLGRNQQKPDSGLPEIPIQQKMLGFTGTVTQAPRAVTSSDLYGDEMPFSGAR